MNQIGDIISADMVEAALAAPTKKALFQQIASAMAPKTGLAARAIAAALNDRERLGSTGFGSGVAIPHGKVEGLSGIVAYFGRLAAPIDFQSVDNVPVDLVFVLLSPPDAGADHLKALASVSRLLRDKAMLAKLRGARSRDALFALLSGVEALDAA